MFVLKTLKDYPGFYKIPNYSNYRINKKGEVINNKTNEVLLGSTNPDGYCNIRLTDDFGITLTWGLHRLLAFVFKNPGTDIIDLVVNHENGIKSDNSLDNLEWTTYKGNLEHAGANGLTEKCKPISVRDVDTGIIMKYPSVMECARDFNVSKDSILYRLKFEGKRVFPERKQYRFGHSDSTWYIPSENEIKNIHHGRERKVTIKFLIDNKIVIYDKAVDAARDLNVSVSTLSIWLSKNNNHPIRSGFVQVKWLDDLTPWRLSFNPKKEYMEQDVKRAVIVTNSITQQKTTYSSCVDCCKALKMNTTTLNYRLKSKGQTVFSDGNTYTYL